ncbi:MAG: acyl-CoA carboxylase subunit beta [Thaumarchaeota archaeon]|nr:acyl-CoA carboxylase subunit beta [Nitrososphaerota archaeon]
MPHEDKMTKLSEMNKLAELGGGEARIKDQRDKNKLTARERIELLMDEGSFVEFDKFVTHRTSDFGMDKKKTLGDGVVTGYGKIEGRTVFVFSHDFTVLGGSLGEAFGKKVCKVMDLALKTGAPVIGLSDSGGARIQEGVVSLAAYSEIFFRNTISSGVIPQISAIIGPCAGGAVYSPAMTDFTFMVEGISHMFITGPDVVKAALGQDVTFEALGGASVHAQTSGVAHFVTPNEQDCFALIRRLLSYLPQNNSEDPQILPTDDPPARSDDNLPRVIPDDPNKPYDMKEIIRSVLDDNEFLEVHALWAPNIIVGFGRLNGRSIGVVANQPSFLAGALDINSSNKAARFIRFCDAFNIPILTFVDVPGYLPGVEQEHGGIIKHGSKLLYAYCEATVPKVTVITRKAYGGAYCAMGSKYSKADVNYAWPTAEIAVMGPEGAINIIFRDELTRSKTPAETRQKILKDYKAKFANPYAAAERGIIDAVIDPAETRSAVIGAFEMLCNKRESRPPKKHGNIQL